MSEIPMYLDEHGEARGPAADLMRERDHLAARLAEAEERTSLERRTPVLLPSDLHRGAVEALDRFLAAHRSGT